ncbi:MerR family transcriptional regulator [Aquipuribacter sp. SD81]|uniref:MerR family transcriptional regulator n=1 Tax=Aquipuribacter sp. SD81 TaxID=3127703 RepID=UPI003016C14E
MQIGELAARSGMSLNTLRHYDEVGLVSPSRRSPGGFRLYSEEDLTRLLLIRRMKPLGYGLEEMRALLEVVDRLAASSGPDAAALRGELDDVLAGARERRARLARTLEMADEFVSLLEDHARAPASG